MRFIKVLDENTMIDMHSIQAIFIDSYGVFTIPRQPRNYHHVVSVVLTSGKEYAYFKSANKKEAVKEMSFLMRVIEESN